MHRDIQRTWAEVNLNNIEHNLKIIRNITSSKAKIIGVVKADAYGHGCLEVTKTLLESGVDMLGVAFLDEAKQLRRYDINVPILILGYSYQESVYDLVEYDITPTVFDADFALRLSQAAVQKNKKAKIHIKIDTGMSRLGLLYNENEDTNNNTIKSIFEIGAMPNIEIEGIFSHFAAANEEDESFTLLQFERFMNLCEKLSKNGLDIPIKHICNSAGIIHFPYMHLDAVRVGITIYGLYPSETTKNIGLLPAMQLKSVVAQIKEIDIGNTISYGRKFTADRKMKIATIPIGYADGFSRILTHKAKMIAGDKICSVVGSICMDQCMLDISNVKNINVGDEVIIIGCKNGNNITAEQVAQQMGTINYEVMCVIGKRVPRVYLHNGHIVEVLNYLENKRI